MYKIIYFHAGESAGNPLYIPGNEYYCLTDCQLDLTMGGAGELTFDIPDKNPAKKDIKCLADEIVVYRNDVEIFRGRAVTTQNDFDRTGTLECEGILSYLYDSWCPPYDFSGSVRDFVELVLSAHNKHVGERKHIYLGNIFVKDQNNYIVRSSQDYNRCLDVLTEKLTNNESLGGYLKIRYANGKRYLDYLDNYGSVAEQNVEFGYNLIDLATEIEYSNLVTAILPLGAKIGTDDGEESNERITIADVNNGNIYISDAEMVSRYGWIAECVTWDEVTKPENLLTKAKAYLQSAKYAVRTISAKAVDIGTVDPKVFSLFLGDKAHVFSTPHNIDIYTDVTELSIHPLNPDQNYYTFEVEQAAIPDDSDEAYIEVSPHDNSSANGETSDTEFYNFEIKNLFLTQNGDETEHFVDSSGETVFTKTLVFADRKYRETALEHFKKIAGEGNGLYLTKKAQSDGSEIYYLHDAEKLENSVNITRINERSVAFSTDGGENYSYGYTIDGSIAMDALEANAIAGTTLKISYESLNQILSTLSVDEDGVLLTADNAATGKRARITVTGGNSGESPTVEVSSPDGEIIFSAKSLSAETENLQIYDDGGIDTNGDIRTEKNVVVGEAISSVDGEFTGTLTVNELDSNSLKISTSSDTKTHLYAKSTYISSNSVTYNMLDGSTGDKGDIALTSEWGVKPVAKSSDFAEYLRVKLPGEEWGEHNNPSLYSVSGYGELRCTGIDVRINASMELSDYKTPTSGNDYQELTAPYQLIKTDRNGNVFVFGTLDLSDGALMLPTVKPGGGIQSDVMPQSANKYNIGSSDYYWKNIYVGTIYRSSESNLSTSDRKKKKDFVPIGADFDAKSFLMALKPTTYKFKDGSERTHMGFIAQDVAEAAKATVGDVAAYIAHRKDIKNDEENRAFENISDDIKEWYLDYQEFIAPLVAVVQEQEKRIETLERMIADGLHE